MVIGVLQVELLIDGARSLKDKRRVVASLKQRLHRDFQVSVAEVGPQDVCHSALLGIALAASDGGHCQRVLDCVLGRIGQQRGYVLHDHAMEILPGR